MKIIDIHTHILPNVDDGSDSIDKSIEFIKNSIGEGVETIFLTPHYMYGKYISSNEETSKQFDKLVAEVKKRNLDIQMFKGAEVYTDMNYVDLIEEEKLTLGESNYVLFETSLNSSSSDINEFVFALQRKGYRPILAHPERYSSVHSNSKILEDLMYRDVLLQINASSLLGLYGKKVKQVAWKLLHKGYAHFIASDEHCRVENDSLKEAYDKVVDHIDEFTANLLFYKNPLKIVQNKPISTFYVTVVAKHHRKRKSIWNILFRR